MFIILNFFMHLFYLAHHFIHASFNRSQHPELKKIDSALIMDNPDQFQRNRCYGYLEKQMLDYAMS